MRKILVLSGKRGGYGAMKPMLRLMSEDPEIELQLVLTDQHLDPAFGETINEVRREFAVAATVGMGQEGDRCIDRSRALGRCLVGMSDVMERLKPDICVLYGDRGEVLASALAATTMGVPVAHLQGGDVSGSVDDQMRHSITKLAHLHLVSNDQSADRVSRMGEEAWRISVVGDHHLDQIAAGQYATPAQVVEELQLDPAKPIVVVLQHSETTAPADAHVQMTETLLAVSDAGCQSVVIYPCSDAGYGGVVLAIKSTALSPQFRVRLNLDAELFWGLLSIASVLVGNSSAGIIESPSFKLPTINVGRRQEGRLCGSNVIHAPHSRESILGAIRMALFDPAFKARAETCGQPYGDGKAGERTVERLKAVDLGGGFFVKRMAY